MPERFCCFRFFYSNRRTVGTGITRTVPESLGHAFVRAGKYDEARAAFEKILKVRPNSGFAFPAIAEAYSRADDKANANEFYRRFLKSWANAGKDLSQVREAEKRLQ